MYPVVELTEDDELSERRFRQAFPKMTQEQLIGEFMCKILSSDGVQISGTLLS